jgi:hypothetical protein
VTSTQRRPGPRWVNDPPKVAQSSFCALKALSDGSWVPLLGCWPTCPSPWLCVRVNVCVQARGRKLRIMHERNVRAWSVPE